MVWLELGWLEGLKPLTKVGEPIARTVDPEARLCDQAVEALLHSKDLVEVTRAGIIIREIPCGIGMRLP